ncbi:hypothetical protein FACS1894163_08770 [Spirochaetia bacterium]|nr:hypothetical protein FACS1894163_08770 [Spirochaetia bacterium]
MRAINIMNDKKRDAKVGFEPAGKKPGITFVLADGRERKNVQFVKTISGFEGLLKKYGGPDAIGRAIIEGDPEIDIEQTGRLVGKTRKLYLTSTGGIAYRIRQVQIICGPDGTEKERRDVSKAPANIACDIPLQWTGKEYPKDEALRQFVFSRNYQLRHTSGLSYDFLYDMAKQLHTRNTMMLLGAGKKGSDPIVLSLGGTPYRGFLEGRIEGGANLENRIEHETKFHAYCLILHLTNTELKEV